MCSRARTGEGIVMKSKRAARPFCFLGDVGGRDQIQSHLLGGRLMSLLASASCNEQNFLNFTKVVRSSPHSHVFVPHIFDSNLIPLPKLAMG